MNNSAILIVDVIFKQHFTINKVNNMLILSKTHLDTLDFSNFRHIAGYFFAPPANSSKHNKTEKRHISEQHTLVVFNSSWINQWTESGELFNDSLLN